MSGFHSSPEADRALREHRRRMAEELGDPTYTEAYGAAGEETYQAGQTGVQGPRGLQNPPAFGLHHTTTAGFLDTDPFTSLGQEQQQPPTAPFAPQAHVRTLPPPVTAQSGINPGSLTQPAIAPGAGPSASGPGLLSPAELEYWANAFQQAGLSRFFVRYLDQEPAQSDPRTGLCFTRHEQAVAYLMKPKFYLLISPEAADLSSNDAEYQDALDKIVKALRDLTSSRDPANARALVDFQAGGCWDLPAVEAAAHIVLHEAHLVYTDGATSTSFLDKKPVSETDLIWTFPQRIAQLQRLFRTFKQFGAERAMRLTNINELVAAPATIFVRLSAMHNQQDARERAMRQAAYTLAQGQGQGSPAVPPSEGHVSPSAASPIQRGRASSYTTGLPLGTMGSSASPSSGEPVASGRRRSSRITRHEEEEEE